MFVSSDITCCAPFDELLNFFTNAIPRNTVSTLTSFLSCSDAYVVNMFATHSDSQYGEFLSPIFSIISKYLFKISSVRISFGSKDKLSDKEYIVFELGNSAFIQNFSNISAPSSADSLDSDIRGNTLLSKYSNFALIFSLGSFGKSDSLFLFIKLL